VLPYLPFGQLSDELSGTELDELLGGLWGPQLRGLLDEVPGRSFRRQFGEPPAEQSGDQSAQLLGKLLGRFPGRHQ